jgi:hypothetical protein
MIQFNFLNLIDFIIFLFYLSFCDQSFQSLPLSYEAIERFGHEYAALGVLLVVLVAEKVIAVHNIVIGFFI